VQSYINRWQNRPIKCQLPKAAIHYGKHAFLVKKIGWIYGSGSLGRVDPITRDPISALTENIRTPLSPVHDVALSLYNSMFRLLFTDVFDFENFSATQSASRTMCGCNCWCWRRLIAEKWLFDNFKVQQRLIVLCEFFCDLMHQKLLQPFHLDWLSYRERNRAENYSKWHLFF